MGRTGRCLLLAAAVLIAGGACTTSRMAGVPVASQDAESEPEPDAGVESTDGGEMTEPDAGIEPIDGGEVTEPDAGLSQNDAGDEVPPSDVDAPPEGVVLEDEQGTVFTAGLLLDYGTALVATRAERTFVIANGSASPVSIDAIVVDPADGPFTAEALAQPTALAPGEHRSVTVSFLASAVARFRATVSVKVSSTAEASPTTTGTLRVFVFGEAVERCLRIHPDPIDFGAVGIGCAAQYYSTFGMGPFEAFFLVNDCANPVSITSIEVASASGSFAITSVPLLPLRLPGYFDIPIGLQYAPRAAAPDGESATLDVVQSGVHLATTVRGTAINDPVRTDHNRRQPPPPKRDFLFVIDNSPGMVPVQEIVRANFEAFADYAWSQRADYHIAVTTTSVDGPDYENGRFLPLVGSEPRVLTNRMPDFKRLFLQRTEVGTSGSSTPKLIRPVFLALSQSLLAGHNSGFLRPDASLIIFVVSNGSDHDTTPVSWYASWLLNSKDWSARNDMFFTAIVATQPSAPPSCTYVTTDGGKSTRALEMALWFHIDPVTGYARNNITEICEDYWGSTLKGEGHIESSGVYVEFSQRPSLLGRSPFQVLVDGAEFPQYDARGVKRWDYDADWSAIVFDPLETPDNWDPDVAVSYRPVCEAP